MLILTWNINGIRATKIPLKKLLDSLDADVICLQETKITRDQLDESVAFVEGYNSYFSFSRSRSGYSGVATFCKNKCTPFAAEEGLSGRLSNNSSECNSLYGDMSSFTDEELDALDNEGRTVVTQHKIRLADNKETTLFIINVYCPRADPEKEDRKIFKLRFYDLLQIRTDAILNSGSHVIVLGDINTSHKPIDHCEPEIVQDFENNPSRKWLNQFLWSMDNPNGKFVDTFRHFHPNQEKAFTCWCTVTGARKTNYGTRLDYIFSNRNLVLQFEDCLIMPDVEGSDHCPVKAFLMCTPLESEKCPKFCTRNMPEFTEQQKLFKFLVKRNMPQEMHLNSKKVENKVPAINYLSKKRKIFKTKQKTIINFLKSNTNSETTLSISTRKQSNELVSESITPCIQNPLNNSELGLESTCISPTAERPLNNSELGSVSIPTSSQSSLNNSELGSETIPHSSQSSLSNSELGLENISPSSQSSLNNSELGSESIYPSSPILLNNSELYSQSGVEFEVKEPSVKNNTSAALWKKVFLGPSLPVCKKHKEPCILRTVKKSGANFNKQFYVCARPEGHPSNPEARCDHFQWRTKRK